MTFQLTRNQVYFIGVSIIFLYAFLNRFEYITNAKTTTGYIVQASKVGNVKIVVFKIGAELISFQGTAEHYLEPGAVVPVIYNVDEPFNAYIYSFLGFWLMPIIYTISPFILFSAAVYSFMDKNQRLVFGSGKSVGLERFDKQKNEKGVDLFK